MGDSCLPFEEIYARYRSGIVRYLARFVGRHEAEDLSQEVFVKVSRGLRDFRGDAQVSTWIYRIATNVALDRLRSSSPREEGSRGIPGEDAGEGGDVHGCEVGARSGGEEGRHPVERQVIRKEMNECIQSRIENLPEPYRTVLLLGDLGEFANKEIADLTGASLDAVKIRLHRARARLRKDLETHCSLYHDERNELACDRK